MRRLLGVALALSLLIPASAAFAVSAPNAVLPTWVKSATVYEVNVRQYSSNSKLASVTSDIPRLKSLGVDVLLFLIKLYLRENIFLFPFHFRLLFCLRGPIFPFDVDE
jgi:hypothetical protein